MLTDTACGTALQSALSAVRLHALHPWVVQHLKSKLGTTPVPPLSIVPVYTVWQISVLYAAASSCNQLHVVGSKMGLETLSLRL